MSKPSTESTPPVPKDLIRLDEWAAANQITMSCAHQWIARGKLSGYRLLGRGRFTYVKKSEADAILKPVPKLPTLAK